MLCESSANCPSGLYLVSVPIGHRDDIGGRALSLLSSAHFILCEDTRQTLLLLRSHNILKNQKLLSADEHRWTRHKPLLRQELLQGTAIVAFVSDAGTPGICDPGAALVQWLRSEGYTQITAIPGPSALATFMSLSGWSGGPIFFTGFYPRTSSLRMAAFEAAARLKSLCVGFESPKRVVSLLKDFVSYAGPGQMVIVARELTKTYEQVIRAEAGSILARIERQELPTLGEWVIAFEPHSNAVEGWQEVARSLSAVWEKKKLSQWVAAHFYVSKQEVYDFLIGKIS